MKKKNTVFYISLTIVAILAIWAVGFNDNFTKVSNMAFQFLTKDFGWLYLLAMIIFLGVIAFVAFSKYGKIRLGDDDSRPEYSNMSWFGLLFGCGMGVGLVFWGVAEPLSHYLKPQPGIKAASAQAADFAMKTFFTHWGVLPWVCYSVIGLTLAYFMFRKRKKGLISCLLEPLIGEEKAHGWIGKTVDILAVFATTAGVVTSLGLGTLQINAGMNYLFDIPKTFLVQVIIIVIVSILFISSAVSGLDNAIKKISDINLWVAMGLMVICFVVGPKIEIVNSFVNGIGNYVGNFFSDALSISAYGDNSWLSNWRLFYWAWFIAWAPFVGVFIARISKGRTIREFVLGVVLVPTIASCIWGAVFGNLGINLAHSGQVAIDQLRHVIAQPEVGLFIVLQKYPLGFLLSVVAIISLAAFFITSANSGIYVLSMLTSDGDVNPPNKKKILWGIIQAIMAIGLLMVGGLKPLQTIALVAAFPFIFIMFAICAAFIKALKKERI